MPNFVGYDDAQTLMTAIKNKIDSGGGGGGGELPTKQVVINDIFLDTTFTVSNPRLDATHIWVFNGEVYYSSGTVHLVFDRDAMTWKKKHWNGLSNFDGIYIWTTGTAPNQTAYYSNGTGQYVLNSNAGNTWATQTWSGLTNFDGRYVWSSRYGTFYSSGATQYKLSGTSWATQTWSGLTSFNGNDVWISGGTAYYSTGTTQYQLTNGTTWSTKTWTGLTSFAGKDVWTDGTNVYYSSNSTHYKLSGSTWSPQTWSGLESFSGQYIWTDPYDNTHYSYNHDNFVLSETTWNVDPFLVEDIQSQNITNASQIWTDGNDIYYSQSTNQYKYNKALSQWEYKTWSGLTSFNGNNIWTDGTDVYYSQTTTQYVLDKQNSTWNTKTWSGLTNFSASDIWTDGTDIYYKFARVLDKSTSTWNTKTWSSTPGSSLQYIWTDGTDVYYSNGSNHYVLDKENSAWNAKTWSGLTSFSGNGIWKLGSNVYYSSANQQYVLDKATSTWNVKHWIELTYFDGSDIWTDGDNAYYLYLYNSYLTSKELTTLSTTAVDADIDILYSGTSSTDVDIMFAHSLLDYERLVIKTKSSNNDGLVSYTHDDLMIFYSEMLADGATNYYATQKMFYLPILYQYDGAGYTTISSHNVPHDGYLRFTFGGTGHAKISAQEFYEEAIVQIASAATITIYGIGRRT